MAHLGLTVKHSIGMRVMLILGPVANAILRPFGRMLWCEIETVDEAPSNGIAKMGVRVSAIAVRRIGQ